MAKRADLVIKRRNREARTTDEINSIMTQYALSVQQRLAIRALLGSTTHKEALARLQDLGIDIKPAQLSAWIRKDKNFQAALATAEAVIVRIVSKNNVLRKTETLLEEAMTPKPILYQGEHTGFEEVDLGVATRLVELQGKAVGLFADESALKVAVLVDVDFSGRKEPLPPLAGEVVTEDAAFLEAPPSEPEPDLEPEPAPLTEGLEAAAQAVLDGDTWLN